MRRARHTIISVVFCLVFLCLKGQKNLILNGNMEDTLYCVAGLNNIQELKYWSCPTLAGSYAEHYCVYNNPGKFGARSGYGCAGGYTYFWGASGNDMMYIAGKFSKPLENGKVYCFTMYLKLAREFRHGSNNLGVYIDNSSNFYNTTSLIPLTPDLTMPFTVIDTTYQKFSAIYIATGGETDFIVGGYLPYASANYPLVFPSNQSNGSYFMYDDFSLIEVNSVNLGPDKTICNKSDSILLGDSAWTETKYKWYQNGLLIDTIHSQIKVKPATTSTFVLVQENCNIFSDTIVINVIDDCSNLLDGVHTSNVFTPNGDDLNDTFKVFIENGTIQTATIYNRWGNLIYQSGISGTHYFLWDGHTTSGEACNPGTYFYVVTYTNSQGEQKSIKGFVSLFR